MTISLLPSLPDSFLPQLMAGVALNFEIALTSLLMGLVVGVPLAFAKLAGKAGRLVYGATVPLLRAAPTFVVMFFLLNVMPQAFSLFGHNVAIAPSAVVALSLVPYSASYVSENGAEALGHWREGSRLAALLLLPNLARAFFVMVMSSSAGAAIGVTEGITVILRQAEKLPALGDRLKLFALGILVFGCLMQTGFVGVMWLRRYLSAKTAGSPALAAAQE